MKITICFSYNIRSHCGSIIEIFSHWSPLVAYFLSFPAIFGAQLLNGLIGDISYTHVVVNSIHREHPIYGKVTATDLCPWFKEKMSFEVNQNAPSTTVFSFSLAFVSTSVESSTLNQRSRFKLTSISHLIPFTNWYQIFPSKHSWFIYQLPTTYILT